MKIRMNKNNGNDIITTASITDLKLLIRGLESQGYTRSPKSYSSFILETKINNGIGLVKNTCSEFSTISIFLTEKVA